MEVGLSEYVKCHWCGGVDTNIYFFNFHLKCMYKVKEMDIPFIHPWCGCYKCLARI